MNKTFLTIIIFFAIIPLALFGIWPQYQKLKTVKIQIIEKRTDLDQLKDYFSRLENTFQEISNYPEALAKIGSALPNDPSIPSLLNFLQKKASENGMVLKDIASFATAPVAEKDKLKATTIGIELTGSYESFKNFLIAVEKTDRIIEIESTRVSLPTQATPTQKGVAEKPSELLNFSLKIKTYSY